MHLFICGVPGVGKTTLISTLLKVIHNAQGFYTQEVREHGTRAGFKIVTLGGGEAVFSHKRFHSPHKVSGYGVSVDTFDTLATQHVKDALHTECEYIVLDEIGKMELFSQAFQEVVREALEKKKVIATIPSGYENSFLRKIKSHPLGCILELTKENFSRTQDTARLWLECMNADAIRALDNKAEEIGLTERILIENAASNLTHVIDTLALGKKVCVVAGRGNNGADVLSCARKLLSKGYQVDTAIVSEKLPNEEAAFQASILKKISKVHYLRPDGEISLLEELLRDKDFIIEGLLGTGIRGALSPFVEKVIEALNKSGKKIVSCDIPSGLFPDEGYRKSPVIRADYTVTFIAPKKGFFLNRGLRFCGRIIVADIGISRYLLKQIRDTAKEE